MQVERTPGQCPQDGPNTTNLELTDQDCEDVCKTVGEIDVSKMRMALQSAIYISPMLLLVDAKIYRWSWNQLDILKVRSMVTFNSPFGATNTNVDL